MVNQQLVNYFKKYGSQYPIEQLKKTLTQQGYNAADIEEAARYVSGTQKKEPLPPSNSGTGDLFTFDQKTKDTMVASMIGFLISEVIIFFGNFMIGRSYLFSIMYTIVYAVIGGAIAGFVLSKFYDSIMGFVSKSLSFLLPITNTFFKALFFPVVISSVIGLLFGLLAGSAIFLLGAGIGLPGGGILGAFLGGSFILSLIWSIIVTIIARFVYAKFMVYKVGNYYKNYQ